MRCRLLLSFNVDVSRTVQAGNGPAGLGGDGGDMAVVEKEWTGSAQVKREMEVFRSTYHLFRV